MTAAVPIKVFISYSHDSPEHSARVLGLSDWLRSVGVDCHIDQYEVSPPQGWPLWMEQQIERAGRVLVICTQTYLRRCKGEEAPGIGFGVRWESLMMYNWLYEHAHNNDKFIPVIFQKSDHDFIPTPLQGVSYVLTPDGMGNDDLLRQIHRIPPAEKPPLGHPLVVREVQPAFFQSTPNNLLDAGKPRNLQFVGREDELKRLHEQLAGGNVAILHALTGAGGIGKTQLALEYAYRHLGEYAGIWCLDASDEAIEVSAVRLTESLGLNLPPNAPPEQIRQAIRAYLSHDRHLLILDNVQTLKLLDEWQLPGPARLLAATRHTDLRTAHVRPFPVEVLDRPASIELLRQGRSDLSDSKRDKALDAIAHELGDHALAVALTAGYLRERANVMPDDLLKRLRRAEVGDAKHILEDVDPDQHAAKYALSVAASLSLHLPDFEKTDAMKVLHVLGFCHPDAVPVDLVAGAAGLSQEQTEEALHRLHAVSVVNYGETVSVHRLTQQVLRARLKPAQRKRVVQSLVNALNPHFRDPEDYRNWPRQDGYAAHAESALAHADSLGGIEDAGYLGNQLGVYLQNLARFSDALRVLQTAERIARAARGNNHPSEAARVNNIGLVLKAQGDLTGALRCYREAERIARAAYGDDHPNVAAYVNNIGIVLHDRGDLPEALKCFREAEQIDRAGFGDNHPNVAIRVNNIGSVQQAQGDLVGALKCYREAEQIDRAGFGDNHPNVAIRVNNIGNVLQDQGDLIGALKCYREAERIDRAAFGDDHPQVAIDVNNIGMVLQAQGDLARVRKHYEQSLQIFVAKQGPRSLNAVVCAGNVHAVGGNPLAIAREVAGDEAARILAEEVKRRKGVDLA